MRALALSLVIAPHAWADPPLVTSSATFERRPATVLLFRRFGAFFPAVCAGSTGVRSGQACLGLVPKAPLVRLMNGRTVQLEALASHVVSAWDGPEQHGWAVPASEPAADGVTELAVWPADANAGLTPIVPLAVAPALDGLKRFPAAHRPPTREGAPPWPLRFEHGVKLADGTSAVVVSGARRGLYRHTRAGWRPVRVERIAEVRTALVGSSDVDGDGAVEWLVFIEGVNEFGLEVRSTDLGRVLFEFNDCGV